MKTMHWRRSVGWPMGQVADYRNQREDGSSEHLRLWPNGDVTHHVDASHPMTDPVVHVVADVIPWLFQGRPRGVVLDIIPAGAVDLVEEDRAKLLQAAA